jgi:hypothetical protein
VIRRNEEALRSSDRDPLQVLTASADGGGPRRRKRKAVVRRSVEEGWDTPDRATVDECCATRYGHRNPSNPQLHDREDLKQIGVFLRTAFPDVRVEINVQGGKTPTAWDWRSGGAASAACHDWMAAVHGPAVARRFRA